MHQFDSVEELFKAMEKGDARCTISIGDRVYKSRVEPGDVTALGVQGTVKGNVFVDDSATIEDIKSKLTYPELVSKELYAVEWDGSVDQVALVVGTKIKKL